jgi:hypothetical protein
MYARKHLGVDYGRTLTLGRQEMYLTPSELRAMARAQGIGTEEHLKRLEESNGYSERYFELLGATTTDSMDMSGYEKATIIHDLNVPVPATLHGRYTCVVDGGTLEHVFEISTAFRNCMAMLEPGGHFIGITPANNFMGHGFYQFSPELFFRVFSAANGFEVRTVLLRTASEWYEVADPAEVKERVELVNSTRVSLVVIARKIKEVELFRTPQQSDYASAWKAQEGPAADQKTMADNLFLNMARRLLPVRAKTFIRNFRKAMRPTVDVGGLGTVDPRHYRRVEL